MSEVHFHGWAFEVERAATQRAYEATRSIGARGCTCLKCRNFVAQREAEYPPELLRFLNAVGVEPLTDAEVWSAGPLQDGYALNSGWWHFVGQVKIAGEAEVSLPARAGGRGRNWQVRFDMENSAQKLAELPESPLVLVDFAVDLPWVLDDPHPG